MSRGLSKQQRQLLQYLARWGTCHVGASGGITDLYDPYDAKAHDQWVKGGCQGPDPNADRPGTYRGYLNSTKRALRSLERRGLVTLTLEKGHRDPWPGPSGIRVRDRTSATLTLKGWDVVRAT